MLKRKTVRRDRTPSRSSHSAADRVTFCEPLESRVLLSGTVSLSTVANVGTSAAGSPVDGLVMDSSGNLYGMGQNGMYKVSASTGAVTVISSSLGDSAAELTIDAAGDVFGTTAYGGSNSEGSIFELSADGTLSTLVNFVYNQNFWAPETNVIVDSAGNLFGTTTSSVGPQYSGGIFEIAHGTTTVTDLATFTPSTGIEPYGNIVMDSAGDIFGTTFGGGTNSYGTVYELPHGSSSIVNLHNFNGATAFGGLVADSSENLYGMMESGSGGGTLFEITATGHTFSTLGTLTEADGSVAMGGLRFDHAGNLIGVTSDSSDPGMGPTPNGGTIYEFNLTTDTFTTLYSFGTTNPSDPVGAVAFDSQGNIYGATELAGTSNLGTVYKLSVPGALTTMSGLPSSVTAGVPQAISVSVYDPYGSLDTANTSTISLSLIKVNSSGDTLVGTYTAPLVSGVAHFSSPAIDQAGDYILSAGGGGPPAVSDSFSVTPAAVSTLTISQQSTANFAGQTLGAIEVKLFDQFGNPVVNDNADVTISANGPLSGTTDATAVNGVANFSDLQISSAGNWTITASAGPTATLPVTVFPSAPAGTKLPAISFSPNLVNPSWKTDSKWFKVELVNAATDAVVLSHTYHPHSANAVTAGKFATSRTGVYTVMVVDSQQHQMELEQVDVVPAVAKRLVFVSQPASLDGQSTITVALVDKYGNNVSSSGIAVSLKAAISGAAGSSALTGTTTVTTVDGVATFSGLVLNHPGKARIIARSASLKPAISNQILGTT